MYTLLFAKPWFRVFATPEEEAKAAADKAAADKAAAASAAALNGEEEDKPKFSQKQLNKFLADDRRKHEDRVAAAVKQLEDAKKAKGLSEAEKQGLQSRIEELSASLLTKEEQAKLEIEKKDKAYKKQLDDEANEKAFWQQQYAGESTRNQIMAAALEFDAVRPSQIEDLLTPKTRLVEITDADGKSFSLKKFAPKVKLRTVNDKGEEIELDLTIKEAVKRMKDEPEQFGNLFKSGLAGGLGAGGTAGGAGGSGNDRPPTDPKQYRAWRKQHKQRTT